MSEPLLRIAEAAAALTLSRATLYRLIAEGRIRVVHPSPGRVAIERREVDAYLASLRRAA